MNRVTTARFVDHKAGLETTFFYHKNKIFMNYKTLKYYTEIEDRRTTSYGPSHFWMTNIKGHFWMANIMANTRGGK